MKAKVLGGVLALVLVVGLGVRTSKALRNRAPATAATEEVSSVLAATVTRGRLAEKVTFTGTIRPRNEVDIYPKVPGRVEALKVSVGDKVKAGQVIAVVEHKEIAWQAEAAAAAQQVAQAGLDGAQLEHDRTLALLKGGSATQAQYDGVKVRLALAQAQLAQAKAAAGLASQSLANATIVSPIDGTIVRRPVNLGTQLAPQSIVATVQDLVALKLEASVDAAAHARLRKGASAEVMVDVLPDERFAAQVTLLSPSLDAISRRAALELEVDNSNGRLLPNMFARAEVTVGQLDGVLAIPRAALWEGGGGAVVFRLRDGRVQAVRPQLGASDGHRVAVLEGLAEGEQVAVSGVATLNDGAAVKIAPAQAAPAADPRPN